MRALTAGILRRLRGLFEKPVLVHVERAPGPLLPGGRTQVRVVARGTGRLVVGDLALWVGRACDIVLSVPALEKVTVRIANLAGHDARTLVLGPFFAEAPVRLRIRSRPADAVRTPREDGVLDVVVPRAPAVALAVRRVRATGPRLLDDGALRPSLHERLVYPRVRLPDEP